MKLEHASGSVRSELLKFCFPHRPLQGDHPGDPPGRRVQTFDGTRFERRCPSVTYHPKPAIGYRVKPGHLSGDDIVLQHGATGVTKAAGTIIATEPAAT
ncbi:MAG TPA: hypothetical protein VNF26_06310 [Candidatus Baltobacterales bacterium]|nr:hypothetical protein [Candidatus Baltobacterales bacterium]